MEVVIRKGEPADFPALLGLIKELALFEKEPDAVTNSVEQMQQEQQHFEFYVAEYDGEIIGAAVYFFAYYTWVGKSMYLDDLYVKPEYRRQKVGSKLIRKIFQIAQTEKCQRLRWQVLDWNTDAIAFYKKIGAKVISEWLNCDFTADEIDKCLKHG